MDCFHPLDILNAQSFSGLASRFLLTACDTQILFLLGWIMDCAYFLAGVFLEMFFFVLSAVSWHSVGIALVNN